VRFDILVLLIDLLIDVAGIYALAGGLTAWSFRTQAKLTSRAGSDPRDAGATSDAPSA
jgi:hypothetical protein